MSGTKTSIPGAIALVDMIEGAEFVHPKGTVPCCRLRDGRTIVVCADGSYDLWSAPRTLRRAVPLLSTDSLQVALGWAYLTLPI